MNGRNQFVFIAKKPKLSRTEKQEPATTVAILPDYSKCSVPDLNENNFLSEQFHEEGGRKKKYANNQLQFVAYNFQINFRTSSWLPGCFLPWIPPRIPPGPAASTRIALFRAINCFSAVRRSQVPCLVVSDVLKHRKWWSKRHRNKRNSFFDSDRGWTDWECCKTFSFVEWRMPQWMGPSSNVENAFAWKAKSADTEEFLVLALRGTERFLQ